MLMTVLAIKTLILSVTQDVMALQLVVQQPIKELKEQYVLKKTQ
jgi:hypothetical protein